MTTPTPTGVFVRLPLSESARELLVDASAFGQPDDSHDQAILSIGTPVTSGDLHEVGIEVVHAHGSDLTYCRDHAQKIANGADGIIYSLIRQSDHLAALASLQAEVGRLLAKQPLYDRVIQENAELKLAVARLQKPEFYGTEGQDIGSDDVSSLFDFCENNEVIEVNGYRCVSTQFGFSDGIDVHLYNSEAEAVSAATALKGPEA